MKVVLSSPLGQLSQESGLLYLLANYMNSPAIEFTNIRCNGVFSLCDKDIENGWRREVTSCLQCAKEQKSFSDWAGIRTEDLSRYLPHQDVERTKRWILTVPTKELTTEQFDDVVPFELCRHLFHERFGQETPVVTNKLHENFLRRALLAVVRMTVAARRFLFAQKPDLIFIAGGKDFITAALGQESIRMGFDTVVLRWNLEVRAITIHHPRNGKVLHCELVTNGVTQMRNDPRTWPREVTATLDDILKFLEIPQIQGRVSAAR